MTIPTPEKATFPSPTHDHPEPVDFIEQRLAMFLEILAAGRFELLADWKTPLLPDGRAVIRLSSSPSPSLTTAWGNFAAAALSAADPANPAAASLTLTPQITAQAIAAANLIFLLADRKLKDSYRENIIAYTRARLAPLTPAEDYQARLLYDAFTTPVAARLRELPAGAGLQESNELFRQLLRLNPLSELQHLDLERPETLRELTGEYLVRKPGESSSFEFSGGCSETADESDRKKKLRWWFRAEDIYADAGLRRMLIDRWLELPENGRTASAVGIFLEELRRRDRERFRRPILEFYEAYDYLGRENHHLQNRKTGRLRPALAIIDRLLKSGSRTLNRRGNERFLKFRALLEIIAEERSVPREFKHLSRDFCLRELAPLSRLATVIGGNRKGLSQEFSGLRFFDRPN